MKVELSLLCKIKIKSWCRGCLLKTRKPTNGIFYSTVQHYFESRDNWNLFFIFYVCTYICFLLRKSPEVTFNRPVRFFYFYFYSRRDRIKDSWNTARFSGEPDGVFMKLLLRISHWECRLFMLFVSLLWHSCQNYLISRGSFNEKWM